ncbi:hypothetical protein HPNQ4200_0344 [Helicobacter pylori NQ4200]|uniref:Uncharacterized protein n=1 Tax=Helicobacter pylori NQ4200 TaxID=992024 RepID=I9Q625_HELPX|nr:hypothetical protein HPNQ4200_0344 [Helicobacter pylori NQ4200]
MKTHKILLGKICFKIRYNRSFNVFQCFYLFGMACSSLWWCEALKTDPLFLSDRII